MQTANENAQDQPRRNEARGPFSRVFHSNQAGQVLVEPEIPGRRWLNLLIGILLCGVLAALPVTYLVTYYPTLGPWASLYAGLLLAIDYLLYFLIRRARSRPGFGIRRTCWLLAVLVPSQLGLFFTAAYAWINSGYENGSWILMRLNLGWLVGAALTLTVFVLLWRRTGPIADEPFSKGQKLSPYSTVYYLAACLVFFTPVALSFIGWPQTPPFKVARPAAPWQAQFQTAENAARKLDKDAVLDSVYAEPGYEAQDGFTIVLDTRWYFNTPTGRRIAVYMRDTDPEATVKAEDASSTEPTPVPLPVLAQSAQYWNEVKLGPRDAFDKTVPDASQYFGNGKQYYLNISALPPGPADTSSSGGTPTPGPANDEITWRVSYMALGPGASPNATYTIDGRSGAIVDRRVKTGEGK